MSCGYIAGDNCDFRREGEKSPPQNPQDTSLFSCLVPYDVPQDGSMRFFWEQELPNPLDITGDYAQGNPMLSTLRNSVRQLHYASAFFYRQFWNWSNDDTNAADVDSIGTNNQYNTLCFQGHQVICFSCENSFL